MEDYRGEEGRERAGGNFNRRIKECLAEKATFEQICGGGDRGSGSDMGKNVLAEGTARTKAQQAGQCGWRRDWSLNLGLLHKVPTLLGPQ